MHEEGVEGAAKGFRFGGANPEDRLSPSLLLPTTSWSAAARCFSSGMVDTLRASSNQGAERAVGVEDFTLSVDIERELGEEVRQIWRFSMQREKGIWSKMKGRQ